MVRHKMIAATAALTLLAACDVGAREDQEAAPSTDAPRGETAAGGKAEEGQLSIKAPGFDMKINMPKALTNQPDLASDNPLLYPGASVSGMHIEASTGGRDQSGVEIRFASPDAPSKVAAWYRAAAQKQGFSITSERRDGDASVFTGSQKSDGDPFTLRLAPAGAGTEGRLTLHERR